MTLACTGVALWAMPASAQTNARAYVDEAEQIVYYVAGQGQNNDVTITMSEDQTKYTIDDVVPISYDSAEGCTAPDEADPTRVRCEIPYSSDLYPTVNVSLRDGDDAYASGSGAILPGIVRGGDGRDTLSGADLVWGEAGSDTLTGGDHLLGGSGHDTLTSADGYWSDVYGGRGHDIIHAMDGDDTVHGMRGRDDIRGGRDNDELHGGPDEDLIYGNSGNDLLYGGPQVDELSGGPGDDEVHQD
jgi:Ca2+-binding RTX toxin-like protein